MIASDFITLSGQIIDLGDAGARSATSRAYYGAFHAVIELLSDFGCQLPRRSSHDDPQKCLAYAAHRSAKDASSALGNLQARRIKADYHFEEVAADARQYASYSIKQAEKISQLIMEFRKACRLDPNLKAEFCTKVNDYVSRKLGR